MSVKTEKHLINGPAGKLELEALWQNGNPQDQHTDTIALICHPNPRHGGTMSNKVVTTMYRFARDEGMHAVRFNFRCAGNSTGEHDFGPGEFEDAMTVLQWLNSQTSACKLWLGGFSFGGYITARVAEQMMLTPHIWGLTDLELLKVVLIAPSVVNNDVSDLVLPTKKTIQIYGNADEVVSPDSMAAFARKMHIETHVIEEAGHFFHGRLGELKNLLEKHAL